MDILLSSLWVAMVLYFLYETTVVYSYLKRLPFLNYFTKIKEYEKARQDNWTLPYSLFMQTDYGGFWIELLTCRYCFGFWLAGISSYFCGLSALPAVYFLSQLGFSAFNAIEKILNSVGEQNDE